MPLSYTSHHLCTLHKLTRLSNPPLSRAISNINHRNFSYTDDDFLSGDVNNLSNQFINVVQLQKLGSSSAPYILNKIISHSAKSGSFDVGTQFHSVIIKFGFSSNVYICSALLDMYSKCGLISSAQSLFDQLPERTVVTWNSLISGYLHTCFPKTALELFIEMQRLGLGSTPYTISVALVACSQLEAGEVAAQVHGLTLKSGFDCNVVVGTVLVDVYSSCWNLDDSRQFFDQMLYKNVLTWSSMVSGYAKNGYSHKAITLFRDMLRLGLQPNYVIYNNLLSSFCNGNDLDHCKQVQCCIIRTGLESNAYIAVTLVTVYSKCISSLEDFRKVCLGVRTWDQISWNAVIAGYFNLGCSKQALGCFKKMRRLGIDLDFFTFTSVLGAVGMISGIEEGSQIHAFIIKIGNASSVYVQNALVSMYARCGDIRDSKTVFSLIGKKRDVVSWNALLSGYAHHGYAKEALDLFDHMKKTDIRPNGTTFLALLSACSHGGFLIKGLELFSLMITDDAASNEPPRVEHFSAVVDLIGRAGNLHEAEAFVDSMVIKPGPSVYKALLSACQVHVNKDIVERSAKKLNELCPDDPATYILLSNVLKREGYWNEAAGVIKVMFDREVRKKPGCSWI